ncbi:signal recognition particle-docking protein FtsY [Patescibacteria group bacterium]|nr:signal recognition particle-docking protein FtsY [Patescibacteria group bacterium]
MNILQTLVQRNLLSSESTAKVQEEAKRTQKLVEEVLLKKKLVEEELLFTIKSEGLQIPLRSIEQKDIPLKVLELIPEDAASHYRMVPLAKRQGVIEVGMIAPEDVKAKEALNFLSRQGGFSFQVALLSVSQFAAVMRHYKNQKNEMSQALGELQEEFKDEKGKSRAQNLTRLVEEAPVTKMVAVILRNAVEGKASDIHIEPTKDKLRVRFRMLGDLYSSLFLPKRVHQAIVSRIKILSNLKIDEQRIPQDGRFSAVIDERSIDFRVSTFPTALGEKVAIRVLDPEVGLKGFDELGLEGSNLEKAQAALKRPFGLILVTGPTGSGKTTTIAKIADLLNKNKISSVLAASDTFRAASIEQLQIHADKLGIKLIKHDYGSDPAAVAFDAIKHAKAKNIDVVLIDTAGRLHSNENLMQEMKKIIRVSKPNLKIFVGEAITGNDCVEQAKTFDEAVGIDGIILAKADVDEKGGTAISISYVTKKPIMYLGTGQEYSDLKEFEPNLVTEGLGL